MRRGKGVSSSIYICLRPLARDDQRHCWCFGAGTARFVGASGGHHQGPQEVSGSTLLRADRLHYKKEMRPIGTFDSVAEAVAALAVAQAKYDEGGEAYKAMVWQKEKEQRAPRGSVRRATSRAPARGEATSRALSDALTC